LSDSEEYTYETLSSTKEIVVSYDFDDDTCTKNEYEFSLEDAYVYENGDYYVQKDTLESILNCELSYCDGEVITTELSFVPHEWTERYEHLIAHAGGAIREESYVSYYTNSKEALVENYNLGHRVFEFDFYLTSDSQLALAHDWNHQYLCDGTAPSTQEWENSVSIGQPDTEGRYTTMMVGDLLDEMLVNKDMFVVTDTKYTESEYVYDEFYRFVENAQIRDPELLDRIIPQIYNEEMYDTVMSLYDFPSVIYTVYATGASADEIIDFATEHDNIKVITAPVDDERFDETTIAQLHENGLLIFNHTVYTYTDMVNYCASGIDGLYSGLLLPRDMELYEETIREDKGSAK
jgi:glycerophosphoryl diester phosphodiesterase